MKTTAVKINLRQLSLCALMAAVTAVFAQIVIPIGTVPISLATLAACCAGALLGWQYGALSQLVYLMLGAFGLPVFANFRGGLGVLWGPTGGYLVGYVVLALIAGLGIQCFGTRRLAIALSLAVGNILCLALGTVWFCWQMDATPMAALTACVIPFLPGDAAKIVLATWLTRRLRPVLWHGR